jgi:uncharacterized protein (DUF1778 family)
MNGKTKTSQLQVRVSPAEKAALQRAARKAGLDLSAYVLSRVLPAPDAEFRALLVDLTRSTRPAYVLATLNNRLSAATGPELLRMAAAPPAGLDAALSNYVAAMVELAAHRAGVEPPAWVRDIPPLPEPLFGSDLESLRLYLLTHSPAPFRRRNIFIDSTLGDRV